MPVAESFQTSPRPAPCVDPQKCRAAQSEIFCPDYVSRYWYLGVG